VTSPSEIPQAATEPQRILHICKREMLRPLRDEILRLSGFQVESTCDVSEAITMYSAQPYALVLVDVEGERGIAEAETLCSDIKKVGSNQRVAFVCNWRVAILTECPDDILRTEFNPAAFVAGVQQILAGQ
jgi:DNA-binding response OmpR family regulator